MTGRVHFQEEQYFQRQIESLFSKQKSNLRSFLPYADIRHVGSTAVPGMITKGDLDIQVRVAEKDFEAAKKILDALYDRNEGSPTTEHFISFKDDSIKPPLGIQLTVKDSEFDIFWKITEVLKESESWRSAYNELKQTFEGHDMEEYRKAKSDFLQRLMQTSLFQAK
ncbi:GrpB family protein [Ectobacillus polymachus]|uniref:GrpB family protein n=1 Tax=Ectobacillus polymachus TaxID=1508806 RepID=UPI003A84DBC5